MDDWIFTDLHMRGYPNLSIALAIKPLPLSLFPPNEVTSALLTCAFESAQEL